ncbi:hypothetical protein PFISCL1PPCAC_15117, partial [Pristionchus fissidentatus]
KITVSRYENRLNAKLGGKTSPAHPGKIKRYRCIEEYVDPHQIEEATSSEFDPWHKVSSKEVKSMNLKMNDRNFKALPKTSDKSEESAHQSMTPSDGIQYHEQTRSRDTPFTWNRARRRQHVDYYPMEYYDDYDYMPVYRRARRRIPYGYRMKRTLPLQSDLSAGAPNLYKSPYSPLPSSHEELGVPMVPSLLLPSTSRPPLSPQTQRPLRSQLNVRKLSSPDPLTPSPPVSAPSSTTIPPHPIILQKEKATPETCAKMKSLASQFGITDVLDWASSNCVFLQGFAPGRSCEEILEFIATCKQ